MESNRAFGIYVAVLVGGIASVITASVTAGVTAFPTFFVFAEHIAMSLLFRTAYKSFDGPYHVLDTLRERRAERDAETSAPSGTIAGAAR